MQRHVDLSVSFFLGDTVSKLGGWMGQALRQYLAPAAFIDVDPMSMPPDMQAVAAALKATARPEEDVATRKFLDAIELEQSKIKAGYNQALREIRDGGKATHWVWYIWPSMDGIRTTSRPQFLLPNVQAAQQYIEREVNHNNMNT